jgi:hypothetical protein
VKAGAGIEKEHIPSPLRPMSVVPQRGIEPTGLPLPMVPVKAGAGIEKKTIVLPPASTNEVLVPVKAGAGITGLHCR